MIKLSDIIRAIADALEADATFRRSCERWKNGYRLLVGHLPEQPLQAEDDRVVIGIGIRGAYDLGYVQTREAPVEILVVGWDKELAADGVREDYAGALAISDLCQTIVEAVRGITCLGDDLLSAAVTLDGEEWPLVKSTIALSVQWPVALNSEATL